jgi:hypothetical protein
MSLPDPSGTNLGPGDGSATTTLLLFDIFIENLDRGGRWFEVNATNESRPVPSGIYFVGTEVGFAAAESGSFITS